MGRLILLLLIAGGFVVFAAQNLSPVALVVLGVKTQALPLSVWVLSFVAAGALTTLLLSGFFSLSKSAAVRQSTQRPPSKPSSPWKGATPKNPVGFTSSGAGAGAQDDWERSSSQDDWTEPQAQPSGRRESRLPVRDTPRDNIRSSSPDLRDTRSQSAPRDPGRSPLDQAGFSRREEPRKSSEVYDAEYRVLIPPYSSPPAAEPKEPKEPIKPLDLPKKPTNPEDEDWV